MTSTISVSEDLLDEGAIEMLDELRREFAFEIAADFDAMLLQYLREHYWTCFWCGTTYWRNHRPVKCQICGSTIFEWHAKPWRS